MKGLVALLLIVSLCLSLSFVNARAAEETTLQSVLEELENLKKIISQQQTIISQQQTKIGSLEENLKSITEQNRKLQEEVVHLKSDQEVIREKLNLKNTKVPNRPKNVIWTVCLICFFLSLSRILHSYGDVTYFLPILGTYGH